MRDNLSARREMEGDELAFCNAAGRILVRSMDEDRSFAESVDDLRRLEAEFVARAGDDEWDVRETRRRIAELILNVAVSKRPPLEVCREGWKDMVRLGFSGKDREYAMASFFAECCRYDEQPEEGLAVLLPLVAELERGLEEARAAQSDTDVYEYHLEYLRKLRDALLAQQKGEEIAGKSTRRSDEAQAQRNDGEASG